MPACLATEQNEAITKLVLTDEEKKWIEDHKTVRVRISRKYPPFEFYEKDRHQGIAVDYLDIISERLGIEYEAAPDMPWPEALEAVKAKRDIDLILLITHTPEREEFLKFSEDYVSFPQVIFATTQSPFISGTSDLKGRKVAVEKGYIMKAWLERDVSEVESVEVQSSEEALRAVSVGEADVYVGNLAVGQYIIEKKGFVNLKVAAPTHYEMDSMAMGVRKDWPELAGLINKALDSMTEDEHRAIYQKWLTLRYEYGIGIGDIIKWVLIVSAVAFVWILQLRMMVKRRTKELRDEITVRKQAEEARIRSERNYQEIYNATNEAIFLHDDKTGDILDVNDPMLEMYGYSRDEALALKVSDLSSDQPPYTQDEAVRLVRKAVEEGPQVFEWLARRKNDELFWVEVALRSSDIGGEGRVLAVVRDITERKHTEELLEKWSHVINNAEWGIVVGSPDGKMLAMMNPAFAKMHGYTVEELTGQQIVSVFAQRVRKEVPEHIRIAHEKGHHAFESIHVRKDGSEFPVYINVTAVKDKDGVVLYRVANVQDITEFKEAEERLIRSEQRFRELAELLPEGVYEMDLNGRLTYANLNAYRLFGYTGEDFLKGIYSLDMVAVEDHERATQNFNKILSGKDIGLQEYTAARKDGSFFPMLIHSIVIKLDDETTGIRGILIDNTERKLAEEALRESEAKFREIAELLPNIIVEIDLEGRVTYVNRSAYEITGYSEDNILGKNFMNFVVPVELERAREISKIVLSGKPVRNLEYTFIKKDGNTFNALVNTNPVIKNGEVVGRRSVVTDITDIKKAEELILHTRKNLQLILESTPYGIIIINRRDKKVMQVNNAALKAMGYDSEEAIVGRICHDTLCPAEAGKCPIIDLGQEVDKSEKVLVTKDGRHVPILKTVVPIMLDDEEMLLEAFVDITERKQAEEKIRASLREKEILLAEIHHRVKNNMAVIIALLKLQAKQVDIDKYKAMFLESCDRIKSIALVHEGLYESKDLSVINFKDYIERLVNKLFTSYSEEAAKVGFHADVSDVTLGIETAAPCGLIINELVINSLKHAFPDEREGKISLSLARTDGDELELVVKDNGVGFPKGFDFKDERTFGIQLINALVKQLSGKMDFRSDGGAEVSIKFMEMQYRKRI